MTKAYSKLEGRIGRGVLVLKDYLITVLIFGIVVKLTLDWITWFTTGHLTSLLFVPLFDDRNRSINEMPVVRAIVFLQLCMLGSLTWKMFLRFVSWSGRKVRGFISQYRIVKKERVK